jgi:hypothetical protein
MAKIINSPAAPAPVSWLFVEDAAGGTITGPDDQHLKLKLNKVRKYITEFTDRPNRQAFARPNTDFFTAWPEMFAGDPPNAVLSYSLPGQQQPLNIVLTLTNPQYDALKRTVSYDAVRILQATDIPLDMNPDLAPFQTHKTPARFGKASLFIDDATTTTTTTYAVGETGPAGGIVFYLTPGTNGLHGLEAAPVDQSSGIQWGCYGTEVGSTGYDFGTGYANTNAIIKACDFQSAARLAASYISPAGVGGWYLPSFNELNHLYEQRSVVGGLATDTYWSSTEYNSDFAWQQNLGYGGQNFFNKNATLPVRAVRAF